MLFRSYESRKGKELTWNPYAAMVFFWREMQRQVRIEGRVEKITKKESEQYFHSRPHGSQLGALASAQSTVITREELDNKYSELEKKYSGKDLSAGQAGIPMPKYWGGYKVMPHVIEFWQGRTSRLHDRIRYTHHGKTRWDIERLSP